MKKLFIPIILITYLGYGCSSASEEIISTQAISQSRTLEAVITKAATETSTSSAIQTGTAPAETQMLTHTPIPTFTSPLAPIKPAVVKICPNSNEISLSDLAINPNLTLFIAPSEDEPWNSSQSGLWFVESDSTSPIPIPKTASENDFRVKGFDISPTGELVASIRYQPGDQFGSIWVSTVKGDQQWEIAQTYLWWDLLWINPQELVIIGMPEIFAGDQRLDYAQFMPLKKINVQTFESVSYERLPDDVIVDFGTVFVDQQKNLYAFYHKGTDPIEEYFLYDYSNKQVIPILQWITKKNWVNNRNLAIRVDWAYNKPPSFMIGVQRPYGVDMAFDLDLNDLQQEAGYSDVMQPIYLPGNPDHFAIGTMIRNSLITVSLAESPTENYPVQFYIFDTDHMVLQEYCLKKWQAFSEVKWRGYDIYLALSFTSPLGDNQSEYQDETIILDVLTGHFARIKHFQFIGWGRKIQ